MASSWKIYWEVQCWRRNCDNGKSTDVECCSLIWSQTSRLTTLLVGDDSYNLRKLIVLFINAMDIDWGVAKRVPQSRVISEPCLLQSVVTESFWTKPQGVSWPHCATGAITRRKRIDNLKNKQAGPRTVRLRSLIRGQEPAKVRFRLIY